MALTTSHMRTAADAVWARDGVDVAGLSRGELLELSHDLAGLRRAVDVAMAQVAAEVDRRSAPDAGSVGLAAREGFRSASELIARATGGSVAEARRLVAVGELLAGACNDTRGAEAGPLDRVRAQRARLVRSGRVSVEVGAVVTAALVGLPDTASTQHLFSQVLDKAEGLAIAQVRALVWRAQAHSDPGAWERREERQYGERYAALRDDADGMVTLTARLTSLDAAPVRAVLDANVRWAMQQRRENPSSDDRSAGQMRADILVGLCRHALDCEQPTSGVKTTVVVRMTLAELLDGSGIGEVDGVRQPVSVAALRQLSADAEVIPAILGGKSEVLDWGRAKRLFTQVQRLALVERDGGCAWCNAPPSWCEAHHIRWWERDAGPTDLSNGVLLCARCHHRVHRDGWDIEVRGDGVPGDGVRGEVVWFTPPRAIDPTRTPRVGGRAAFAIAA